MEAASTGFEQSITLGDGIWKWNQSDFFPSTEEFCIANTDKMQW